MQIQKNTLNLLGANLALHSVRFFDQEKAVEPPSPEAHRFYVIDGSGSMYGSIQTLAENLINFITNSARAGDMISIVRFSSTHQYNVVVGAYKVSNSADLAMLSTAIRKNLYASGMTSFVGPLKVVDQLMSEAGPGHVNTLMFMSDGYDNSGMSTPQIVEDFRQRADNFAQKTIVEYGYHANRNLLMKIAESIGARYIFSEDVEAFSNLIEAELSGSVYGVRKVAVDVASPFGVALATGPYTVLKIADGQVMVPERNGQEVFFLTETVKGAKGVRAIDLDNAELSALFQLVGYHALHMDTDLTLDILRALGDVSLTQRFVNSFSKQDYSSFSAVAEAYSENLALAYSEGYDPDSVPADDVNCVFDLMSLLAQASEEDADAVKINLDLLNYKRIGRRRVSGMDAVAKKLEELTARMTETRDPNELRELAKEIGSLGDQAESVRFIPDSKFVPLNGLTWNETRPNLSTRILQKGYVIIPEAKQHEFNLPAYLPTHIYRNFAVVSDGVVNLKQLPLVVSRSLGKVLIETGYAKHVDQGGNVTIDLSALPVINARAIKELKGLSADRFAEVEFSLKKIKASNRVVNYFKDMIAGSGPKMAETIARYGEGAANWLKDIGVTDNGFSPKSIAAESEDFYMSREIKVAFKGMSALDTMPKLIERLEKNGKLNALQQVMADVYYRLKPECDRYLENPQDKAFPELLKKVAREETLKTREIQGFLAKMKFGILVGHIWFAGQDDIDQTSGVVEGVPYTISVSSKKISI